MQLYPREPEGARNKEKRCILNEFVGDLCACEEWVSVSDSTEGQKPCYMYPASKLAEDLSAGAMAGACS